MRKEEKKRGERRGRRWRKRRKRSKDQEDQPNITDVKRFSIEGNGANGEEDERRGTERGRRKGGGKIRGRKMTGKS